MKHLQDRPEDWEKVDDATHMQALLNPVPFPDPGWIQYLRKNRPHLESQYKALFNYSKK